MKYIQKSSHTPKGFTLIEIMVALTIVSVGIVAILASISQSARNQSRIQDKMIATWVAENRFAYLKSLDDNLKNDSGRETMAGRVWYYDERVESMPNINLQKVTVTISLKDNSDKTVGSYVAYIPKPFRQIDTN